MAVVRKGKPYTSYVGGTKLARAILGRSCMQRSVPRRGEPTADHSLLDRVAVGCGIELTIHIYTQEIFDLTSYLHLDRYFQKSQP